MKFIRSIIVISLLNFVTIATFLFITNNLNAQNPNIATPLAKNVATKTIPGTKIITPSEIKENPIKKSDSQSPNKPAQANKPTEEKCIITVEGNKYDVTSFRNQHSGGNIFQCGTDMTTSFFGQHEQQLLNSQEMQTLRIP